MCLGRWGQGRLWRREGHLREELKDVQELARLRGNSLCKGRVHTERLGNPELYRLSG